MRQHRVDGVESPRHRGDAATGRLASWRGASKFDSTQVNADVKGGLKVRVLSDAGAPLCGRAANITGPADATRRRLLLVSDLAERAIRFEFRLEDAALYAFWVAGPDGKSGGFLAGGALGHGSLVDE